MPAKARMSKTYTLEILRKMRSKTDLERVKHTSEVDIMEQSIVDPDTPKERKKKNEHQNNK